MFSLKTHIASNDFGGRYITNKNLESYLTSLPNNMYSVIGYSELNKPIYNITLGSGNNKVLLWSQMHGNESTSTKALIDAVSFLNSKSEVANTILNNCTLFIIPILNPDGAQLYTRHNANNIDLNRDAENLSQTESKLLRHCFTTFKPNFCFNLHDQRTMYSIGNTNNSSVLSFLSPSYNKERALSKSRKMAMEVIGNIYEALKEDLPNSISRYDDTFNINCVGDTFQSLETPTILFESGHFPGDYSREITRKWVYQSILIALQSISGEVAGSNYKTYFEIPENGKRFFDIIIRDACINSEILDIGINYLEVLDSNTINFVPKIIKISSLKDFYGHKELVANKNKVYSIENEPLTVDSEIDFVMINNEKISLKP